MTDASLGIAPLAPFPTLPASLVTGTFAAGSGSASTEFEHIVEYLVQVALVRGVPLNVPLAFNALAFGFTVEPDTGAGRYSSPLVEVNTLPLFALGQDVPVLPSGALARLQTPGDPLPVEVLYREGEHGQLEADGSVPAWLSGAPQGATGPLRAVPAPASTKPGSGPEPVGDGLSTGGLRVRERLVPDVAVLVAGGRTRARRLDERHLTLEQHVLVSSQYDDAQQADLPESRLYAQYLLQRQRDLLVAVMHAAGLGPASAQAWELAALEQMLTSALNSVEVLLQLSPLVQWRESWLHPQALRHFRAGRDGVDADDLARMASGLGRNALGRDLRGGMRLPDRPAYLALGPALRTRFAGTEAVRSVRYPTTIACAHLTLVEHLQEADGVLEIAGRAVHLRLDDAFQGGGIWRAEVLPQPSDPSDLAPVDLPLALGWSQAAAAAVPYQRDPTRAAAPAGSGDSEGAAPNAAAGAAAVRTPQEDTDQQAASAAAQQLGPAAPPVPEQEELVTDTRVGDTQRSWTFPLTQRAWDAGTLTLTGMVSDAMHDAHLVSGPLQVLLQHPGVAPELLRQPVTLQARHLAGVTWPGQMFIGMRLIATWSLDGGGYFVSVSGVPLDEPVIIDGIPLDYEFDTETLLRSWGTPQDLNDPGDALSPALVLRLLRRYGLRSHALPGLTLFLPWTTLRRAVLAEATTASLDGVLALDGEALAVEVERCVDGLRLRSTMKGSVLVEWGVGSWHDDSDGPYLQPATVPHRSGHELDRLCVTLRLMPKPSGRTSLKVQPTTGLEALLSQRRGHSRVLTRGTPSKANRGLLLQWADARGIDRAWLHPQATFVSQSEVRRSRRRY